jgi:hypothetical protein
MRHNGSPSHRYATTISLLLMILICLILVEAIRGHVGMVLASGATKVVKLLGRMTVLVE